VEKKFTFLFEQITAPKFVVQIARRLCKTHPRLIIDAVLSILLLLSTNSSWNNSRRVLALKLGATIDRNSIPSPAGAVAADNSNITCLAVHSASTSDVLDRQAADRHTGTRSLVLWQIAAIVILLDEDTVTVEL